MALARARMAVSSFAVGLRLLNWITARRMFGFTTAVVAGLLLIFEPNVLAYGSLVMTDIPVACMLLFAVLGFYLRVQRRTVPFFLSTALATGLTLSAKHSGVVIVPILGLLAVTDAFTQPEDERPRWRSCASQPAGDCVDLRPRGRYRLGGIWNAFCRVPRSATTAGNKASRDLRQRAGADGTRNAPLVTAGLIAGTPSQC